MQTKQLKLDFQGYWHVGNGRGEGYHLDAVCLKDNVGLPYVSGKQLKGLLRHAVHRAESWGWYADLPKQTLDFETLIFGSRSQEASRFASTAGMLFVGNATLATAEYEFLRQDAQAQLRQYLFQDFFNTAIDAQTGTAKEHSLRAIEAALPMVLHSELACQVASLDEGIRAQQTAVSEHLWHIIDKALPLIDAVGANRSRGFGEVIVTLEGQS